MSWLWGRYTDFKYSITGIPDYLELDPTVESNKYGLKRRCNRVREHLTSHFMQALIPSEMYQPSFEERCFKL